MTLFDPHLTAEQADSLADYLPGGRLFQSARTNGSNLRKLLNGLGNELFTAEGYLRTISNEYDINTTTLFIEEWEAALGIPDDCFTGTGTIQDRRRDVLVKLASLGVQTEQDFIGLAALFGIVVTIEQGANVACIFPFVFPCIFFSSGKEARFTIIVQFTVDASNQFPLTFPIPFGDATIAIVECLFSKLKPANCAIQFNQV